MSTGGFVAQLGLITYQINRYVPITLFIFGIIGNLLNCLVFTRRTLRSTPCAVYFLAASLLNWIVTITAFYPRILDGWNIELDLTSTVPILCQLMLLLLFWTRSLVMWLIAFATVDRYLVSSPNIHRRQKSNLKNTYRSILLICIILFIIWFETPFCTDANLVGTPFKCYVKNNVCRLYNNIAQALVAISIPIIIMLIFGFLTIRNIHQSRRVVPNNNNEHIVARNRRRERSLTKMLLIQVFILTLLTLPYALIAFYVTMTFYQEKSIVQRATENFIYNFFFLSAYIPNCISFFLYTLSGSLFRETFIDIGKNIRRQLRCYH